MIETKIDELIAALTANTAALTKTAPTTVVAGKAASPKVVKKLPAKTEEQVVAEATSTATPEAVKAAVDSMLKANKRDEAIALLASFDGAKSASAISEQGADVMAQFIEQANEILLAA